MQIQVRYNEEKEGIEIIFPDKPEEKVLDKLRELGFRWHRRNKLWYAKINPERKTWAESIAGTEMEGVVEQGPLLPSFEPSLEEIERRNFTMVYIHCVNLDGKAAYEMFVLFEPSAKKARKIAEQFGRRRHGQGFREAQVFPRKYIGDCRKLFAAGLIIRGEDLEERITEISEPEAVLSEPPATVSTEPESEIEPIWIKIHDHLTVLVPDLDDRLKAPESRVISAPKGKPQLTFEFESQEGGILVIQLSQGMETAGSFHRLLIEVSQDWARALRYEDGLGNQTTADEPDDRRNMDEFLESWLKSLLKQGYRIEDIPHQPKIKRLSLNEEIEAFILEKDSKGEQYLAADKQFIRQYSGKGGTAKEGETDRGVLYEFYTPTEIVTRMWGLALKHGYKGGPVLEPACGTGAFIEHAPDPSQVLGYETNRISARIAQILHPEASIQHAAFETRFFAGNIHLAGNFGEPEFELVIGNPPYGAFTGRWAGMGEKRQTKATRYEEYFIQRSLDLLLPGGLLVFVVPSSFMRGSDNEAKRRIAERIHEPLDAFRLPNGIFPNTDIGTDIIVLKRNTK